MTGSGCAWSMRWNISTAYGRTIGPELLSVRFPKSARSAIVSAADAGSWTEFVDEICLELDQACPLVG